MRKVYSVIVLLLALGCAEDPGLDRAPATENRNPNGLQSSLSQTKPSFSQTENTVSDLDSSHKSLQSPEWQNAIKTAQSHMSKSGGQYSLARIILDSPQPGETIRAKIVKVKDLTPEYHGGGGAFQKTENEGFIFVQHIAGAHRKDEHDPLVLSSETRGSQTVWIKVPKNGTLGIVGDIRVPVK